MSEGSDRIIDGPPRMGILMGAGIYLATFLIWSAIGSGRNLHVVPLIVYAASGILLSKVVLRRMILNNPDNMALSGCAVMASVSVGKLLTFLFWPVAYPVIFLFLGIGKVLR